MLTEIEFLKILEKVTNTTITNNFGFIAGTFYPYNINNGMVSASYKEGFIIWKKGNEKLNQLQIKTIQSAEDNLKDCICFILCNDKENKVLFSDKSKYSLYK